MLENYIQILTDGLKQKEEVLEQILLVNQKQAKIAELKDLDFEAFDAAVEEKTPLIEQLNLLDVGFEAVYERNKEALVANKERYSKEIAHMQKKISHILELSVAIQTSEERNKKLIQQHFGAEREKLRQRKVGQKVASDYYKNMNRVNYVDPQLLDQKK